MSGSPVTISFWRPFSTLFYNYVHFFLLWPLLNFSKSIACTSCESFVCKRNRKITLWNSLKRTKYNSRINTPSTIITNNKTATTKVLASLPSWELHTDWMDVLYKSTMLLKLCAWNRSCMYWSWCRREMASEHVDVNGFIFSCGFRFVEDCSHACKCANYRQCNEQCSQCAETYIHCKAHFKQVVTWIHSAKSNQWSTKWR